MTRAIPGPPKRADARRNYDRILDAAAAEVSRRGADASLEEIARQAGVGSATLHRHFPSRWVLLQAVFQERVAHLCGEAESLTSEYPAATALVKWLTSLAVFGATTRGAARSFLQGTGTAAPPSPDSGCEQMLREAGAGLLARAQGDGTVRDDVTILELLTLANAVALATEDAPGAAEHAGRLMGIAVEGLGPPGRTT
ncbi:MULTISPECIES: TetR/AcrR family transcriptional regulator [unclassified Streptomyces]|uniref:TetR/AcrR family transcriptional regulator n=1 Tax=unclassified Streptomyces TaxID=2593676 RepID=UPI000939A61A|nr:TetR/AcrR family transcriptional regulator [Streptomyces sp. CB02058]OKI95626.1 TetR family transcriptional regulator [Streptomyces sp. CB02058]